MDGQDSDVRTFKSSLKRERLPDLTILVGDYCWQIHSHKAVKTSSFFRKLCSDDSPDPKTSRTVVLDGQEPVMIAHLILWWYTDTYSDFSGVDESPALDVPTLMQAGKSDAVGSKPGACTPSETESGKEEDEAEDEEADADGDIAFAEATSEKTIEPQALHARMYQLAVQYGIDELASYAIDGLRTELSWNRKALLPSLQALLTPPPAVAATTDAVAIPCPPEMARLAITPTRNSEIWDLVVTQCFHDDAEGLLADQAFESLMLGNPRFQWCVLQGMAKKLQDAKAKYKELNDSMLPVPKMKAAKGVKRPRKSIKVDSQAKDE